MSKWIGAFAGNVESLLDKVDQAAGHALHKEESSVDGLKGNVPSQWQPPPAVLTVSSTTYSPFLSAKNGSSAADKTDGLSRSNPTSSSALSKLDETMVCLLICHYLSVPLWTETRTGSTVIHTGADLGIYQMVFFGGIAQLASSTKSDLSYRVSSCSSRFNSIATSYLIFLKDSALLSFLLWRMPT